MCHPRRFAPAHIDLTFLIQHSIWLHEWRHESHLLPISYRAIDCRRQRPFRKLKRGERQMEVSVLSASSSSPRCGENNEENELFILHKNSSATGVLCPP